MSFLSGLRENANVKGLICVTHRIYIYMSVFFKWPLRKCQCQSLDLCNSRIYIYIYVCLF